MTVNPQHVQIRAMHEAMTAKHEIEMEDQIAKVRALSEQVKVRLDRLAELTYDARRAVDRGDEVPVRYDRGLFGDDTATLDTLLVALSEESQTLDRMRQAQQHRERLEGKYEEALGMTEILHGDLKSVEADEAHANGAVLHMPGSGAYL